MRLPMREPTAAGGASSRSPRGGPARGLAREVTTGLVVVGVAGSSLGGAAGVVALATRLLGR